MFEGAEAMTVNFDQKNKAEESAVQQNEVKKISGGKLFGLELSTIWNWTLKWEHNKILQWTLTFPKTFSNFFKHLLGAGPMNLNFTQDNTSTKDAKPAKVIQYNKFGNITASNKLLQ